jgi:hypothetical protein
VDRVQQGDNRADKPWLEAATVGGVDDGKQKKRKRVSDRLAVPRQQVEDNGGGERQQRPPHVGAQPSPVRISSQARGSPNECGPGDPLDCAALSHRSESLCVVRGEA